MVVRFEPLNGHDQVGYWGAGTSTIDWCERNYVVTYYAAEFFNSLSSLWIIVYAIMGMISSWQDLQQRCFFLLLMMAGAGSLAFHGTLRYVGQLADELPMVYIALTCMYCIWAAEAQRTAGQRWAMIGGLTVYAMIWSAIHALGGYTIAFQVHFGICLVLAYGRCFWNAVKPTTPPHVARLIYISALTLGSGFVLWLADQFLCKQLHALPANGGFNPQLHAWWHVGLSCGAFYGNRYFAALKGVNSGYEVTIQGSFILPRFTLGRDR